MKNVFILQGGGEHAKVVLDCLLAEGKKVVGIFDPKYDGLLYGVPQLGQYNEAFEKQAHAIVAIGNNALRKQVVEKTRHTFGNTIHPSAIISPQAKLGVGNMILHGSILQTEASISNHVIINTGTKVDHECVIGDYVHIAPGVTLSGTVSVREGAFIGAGAVVIPGRKIGAWATVGAGAVVISDVPDYAVVVGNPARIIKYNKP